MQSLRSRILVALGAGLTSMGAWASAQENPPVIKTLYLTIGRTIPLQMTSRKPIRMVINERDQIALVRPVPDDPTTVLVTGLAPGRTRITLTDTDGNKEIREIGKPPEKK